jgi:hypothetical protein
MKQIYVTTKAEMNPFSERRDPFSERRDLFSERWDLFSERKRKFKFQGFNSPLEGVRGMFFLFEVQGSKFRVLSFGFRLKRCEKSWDGLRESISKQSVVVFQPLT